MATIREVANKAGTSIGTVSKALNGSHTISIEKTELIKRIALELGYKPNARAQGFARKSTRQVAFVTRLGRNIAFDNPHMFEILSGAEFALSQKGYSLTLQNCDANEACFFSKDIWNSKGMDGLMIHASVVSRDLALYLESEKVPHIIIGKPVFKSNLCWIDNDNRLSGEIAAKRLIGLGHENCVLICSYENDNISEDRLSGMKAILGDDRIVKTLRGSSTIESGVELGIELLKDRKLVTAVVCVNNLLAEGCLRAFKLKNIRVPADISMITFDEYPFARFTEPPLTTISIDLFELGMQAGKLLARKIRNPNLHVQSYSTLPVLVERHSDRSLLIETGQTNLGCLLEDVNTSG